jgi:DNA-binding NarL/FixJ family response regulator
LAGGNVVVGHGVACYGVADRFLGLLAVTLGDHDRGDRHLARAVELNREMGATTWLAHALHAHGSLLTATDPERAEPMLHEAAGLAERIGMPTLTARIRAVTRGAPDRFERPDELTGRELQILRLVAAGHSNRSVGEELSISGHTVANHVRSILRKTGAGNRTEAAGYAFRHALIDRPPER